VLPGRRSRGAGAVGKATSWLVTASTLGTAGGNVAHDVPVIG
jgi:hypothetical protein